MSEREGTRESGPVNMAALVFRPMTQTEARDYFTIDMDTAGALAAAYSDTRQGASAECNPHPRRPALRITPDIPPNTCFLNLPR
jgi:hypothetical protein